MNKINILGFSVSNCGYNELLHYVNAAIKSRKITHIITANAAILVSAVYDHELREILKEADITTADGMSIVWAIRLLGHVCKERVTGIDSIFKIARNAEALNHRIFLLGASQAVIEKVTKILKERFPELQIAGYHNGYFDNDDNTINLIKKTKPDIIFIGMGAPRQEKWIYKNKNILDIPILMGVGGSFDVIAGNVSRAPSWIQKIGMEWCYRLIQEPRRLWKRYLFTNAVFVLLFIQQYIIFIFNAFRRKFVKYN